MKRVWDKGVMVRFTQDTMAVTPPLIAEKKHIDQMFDATRKALKEINQFYIFGLGLFVSLLEFNTFSSVSAISESLVSLPAGAINCIPNGMFKWSSPQGNDHAHGKAMVGA